MEKKKKNPADTRYQVSQLMIPNHANPYGNVHGGVIMKIIDEVAAIAAMRHTHKNCVTVSVDRLDFIHPVYIGNIVRANAQINYAGRTSMEVGVDVEAEDMISGEIRNVASALVTFVAIDDNGKPTEIPPIVPVSEEEIKIHQEALERKKLRLNRK